MPISQNRCTLLEKKHLTPSVSLYTFQAQDKPLSCIPGQFISFLFQDPVNGSKFVRSYSIAGFGGEMHEEPSAKGPVVTSALFELLVVNVVDGKGTSILAQAPIGTSFMYTGPAGNLTLREPNPGQAHVFLASSTGIAPFRAMVQSMANMHNFSPVLIFWGMKTVRDLYLLHEWAQWSAQWSTAQSSLQFTVCLSQETSLPDNSEAPGVSFRLGRIQKNLRDLSSETYQIYICGGKQFVLDTKEYVAHTYPASHLMVERFN